MLNSRSRTNKISDIPLHKRNGSGLPVRSVIINSDSLEAFEMKIKIDKQKEQCPASAGNGERRSSVKINGEDACEKNESTTLQKRRSPS